MGRPPHARTMSTPPPRPRSATTETAYDGHIAAVFGLAREITGDAAVAESLTAATFASLHHLGPNPSDSLRACLLTDVHRRAVQWAREEGSTHATDAAAVTAAAAALDGLPADERDVILDAYFGGCTYAQIAKQRGIAASAVAALMQRGLRRLTAPA